MIAHSMGGRTATPFAWQFPERIRALILSGTLGGAVNDEVRAIQATEKTTLVRIKATMPQRSSTTIEIVVVIAT